MYNVHVLHLYILRKMHYNGMFVICTVRVSLLRQAKEVILQGMIINYRKPITDYV